MLNASAIVRSMNSEETIEQTFRSLREQTVPIEIVVVDSGSTDATLAIAKRWCDRLVEIPPQEFTFGKALNVGAKAASGEAHFPLSSHCVAGDERWVERALELYEREPRVAATNGAMFRPDATPLLDTVFMTAEDAELNPYWGYSNHAGSWRATAWRDHRFNEEIEACEDKEWSWRVLNAGWRIAIDPRLLVSSLHRHKAGTLALFRRTRREARALATYADLPPTTVREALRHWWSDIPAQSPHPPLFHRLNYFRSAEIAGRYVGEREGRLAKERRGPREAAARAAVGRDNGVTRVPRC